MTSTTPRLNAYELGGFWDEMFDASGRPREHYAPLAGRLATLSTADVTRRQHLAELSFEARGITFAVNQDPSGLEKIIPFDLIPRLITPEEWHRIERGLEQRVRA
ncbi:MAG: circularly permuted type 2 ATP-grasp protein, partial [Chloroflexota bacterium]|nr:circularly permuted type 2 ATP-grasp protein [Chloroflexota bacterium]